ncbi:hypothetical protein ACS72_07860 [Acinetobacter sp. VT 511]|uniref:hypothetical protein n=1 Tax=Acinetobacter sp. VT 511 TaxID=1675902 RepID=UPI000662B21D|nr:hypothetical protein [Acinetobacter sp. VT 511]KMU99764.1 hypothetical protein ACS72_07860 [Acinetobacter sp. VT 511]
MSIACVRIYLDDDVSECMNGVLRVGRVISEDEQGNETNHNDLVDNTEFHDIDTLKKYIADFLKINESAIEIEE